MEIRRLGILQNMPVFGGIRDEILRSLIEESATVERVAGECFFREGEHGGEMFVLETGHAVVLKRWEGVDYALEHFAPGDCFGEMSLIDMCPRSASVVALDDCLALRIHNASISKLFREDLEQFTLIQMNMAREVSRRLRHADEHLFRERVAANKVLPHLRDV